MAGALLPGAALATPPHVLQRCWLCCGALLLQIPTVLFSNLIFSGTDPVLALGNWHSPYWQMFHICFKLSVQCELFRLSSLHNENT